MTGKKEEFVPIDENNVKMYACGVTVYDLSHIGHARQAIVYAMIADYLRFRGYNVKYVRNYTDVDDKIIKRANEYGKNALDFSREQIAETEKDMADLHITDADVKTKASEYIDHIIKFVEELIEKGHRFGNNSDSEVLLHGFEEWGEELVARLRGMFAFVIFNRRDKSIFAARDMFGIKPFYYYKKGKTFMYSSEIKSFLGNPNFVNVESAGSDITTFSNVTVPVNEPLSI